MTRPTNPARVRTKIANVIRWAEQQGFHIATELQSAIALLPDEPAKPDQERRRA